MMSITCKGGVLVVPCAEKSFTVRCGSARTLNRHRWSGREY